MKKKDIRLYNVLFPMWFILPVIFVFPVWVWLLFAVGNFIIDSLTVYLSARRQGLEEPKAVWKKHILWVWLIGFFCDFVAGWFLVGLDAMFSRIGFAFWGLSPYGGWGAILFPIPGVILAGVMIYWLNRWLAFRKSDLPRETIHKLCLHLALWTAPYTMMIPIYWF